MSHLRKVLDVRGDSILSDPIVEAAVAGMEAEVTGARKEIEEAISLLTASEGSVPDRIRWLRRLYIDRANEADSAITDLRGENEALRLENRCLRERWEPRSIEPVPND